MKIIDAEQRKNTEIHELLQDIKYEADKLGGSVFLPMMTIEGNNVKYNKENSKKNTRLQQLKNWGVIEIIEVDEAGNKVINEIIEKDRISKNKTTIVTGYLIKPIEPKFSKFCEKYRIIYHEIENGGENHPENKPDKTKQKTRRELSDYIKKIICVKPKKDGDRLKVIINDDYLNIISADKTKEGGSWELLYKIAQDGEVYVTTNRKNNLDYFNINKSNRIYTHTKCKLTKILKQEGEYIRPEENIEIKTIGDTALVRKLNRITEK